MTLMMVLGILLIAFAIFLVIAVLMQHGKSHNLSGTIAGASETFFGKSKSTTVDKKLSVATTVISVVFVVLVLVAYLFEDELNTTATAGNGDNNAAITETADNTDSIDTSDSTDTSAPESSADSDAQNTNEASDSGTAGTDAK